MIPIIFMWYASHSLAHAIISICLCSSCPGLDSLQPTILSCGHPCSPSRLSYNTPFLELRDLVISPSCIHLFTLPFILPPFIIFPSSKPLLGIYHVSNVKLGIQAGLACHELTVQHCAVRSGSHV